jgi:hypothetical protein
MTGHHDFQRGYDRGYADGLAAAAKVLAALKDVTPTLALMLEGEDNHPEWESVYNARAAIAKAEEK